MFLLYVVTSLPIALSAYFQFNYDIAGLLQLNTILIMCKHIGSIVFPDDELRYQALYKNITLIHIFKKRQSHLSFMDN